MAKLWEIRDHLRDQAHIHRGVFLAGPPLWAAWTVFLNPVGGLLGFFLNAVICPPKRWIPIMLWLSSYPLLVLGFAFRNPTLSESIMPWHRPYAAQDGLHFFSGTVAGFPVPSGSGFTFPLETDQGRFRASLPISIQPPHWGEQVIVAGRILPVDPPMNPGQVDPSRILRAQGASAFLKAESWTTRAPPPMLKCRMEKLRNALRERLRRYVPAPALGLVAAALLNETEGVSTATRQDFIRSGMQHILAISGQHIGLLFAFLLLGSVCLRLPRKAAYGAACLIAAVYIPAVGAPVSVVRAGYMVAFLLPGVLLERPGSGLHAFCLTLALDLMIHSHEILNLGFQLSYAATVALILGSKPAGAFAEACGGRHPWLQAGSQMLFLSMMVTVFTYPVLAVSTHAMAPWGILGNLVTVPIGAAMLISGLCVWTFTALPWLAQCAGSCSALCSIALEGCVHFLAHAPGALNSIADPSALWVGLSGTGSLGMAIAFRRAGLRAGFGCLALLIALEMMRPWVLAPKPGESRIHFLAVGHGDAAVLELPGAVILIDAGPDPATAQRVVIPYLRSRGINRIDALVLTHPDLDHYGGLPAIQEAMTLRRIIAPATVPGASPIWDCLRASCERTATAWVETRAGDRIYRNGQTALRVLGPGPDLAEADDNNRSVVCLLTTRREKILFTGDIEGPGQTALADSWPLWKGAWLKAPHHGSDRTTLPCFLQAMQTPMASISAGRRPGFPGPHTLEILRRAGTRIGVTSRDGAVHWSFSPHSPAMAANFLSHPM